MNEMTNVTTGEVRFSYAHLFKPYAAMQGQEEKYSVNNQTYERKNEFKIKRMF